MSLDGKMLYTEWPKRQLTEIVWIISVFFATILYLQAVLPFGSGAFK
jgi:hypothetical protein